MVSEIFEEHKRAFAATPKQLWPRSSQGLTIEKLQGCPLIEQPM